MKPLSSSSARLGFAAALWSWLTRTLPFWLSVTAVVLTLVWLCQRMDYQWQWHKLPQYLLQQETEVKAPFDGFAQVQNNQITLQELRGAQTITLGPLSSVSVGNGDLVFSGDVLGLKRGLKAGPLLEGLGYTLLISVLSGLLGLLVALLALLMRCSRSWSLRAWAWLYVEVIRGTPLLVQMFLFYFFIGEVLHIGALTAGVASLTLFTGAYVAEIWRGSLESLPAGQAEAAQVLGLSRLQAFRYVLLPQAIGNSRPALTGQLISLIKDSSLVSVLAINDLSHAGREIVGSAFNPFEVWLSVAALYLLLTGLLSWLSQRLAASGGRP